MKPTRRNYSKTTRNNGQSIADAMFDEALGKPASNTNRKVNLALAENDAPGGSGKTGTRTRPQSKKTKDISEGRESVLPVINEKETFNYSSDSNAFMVFKDDNKKVKEACRTRKAPDRLEVNRKTRNKNGENPVEFSCELFAEEMDFEPRKVEKKKPKKKVPQAKNVKEVKDPFKFCDDKNVTGKVQKDFNFDASIEIARDKCVSPACPSALKSTSPELVIVESARKLSEEEDSVLAGNDSFSTDYEMPTQIFQAEESSKYTYTYVSTYTQGTSAGGPSHSSTRTMTSIQVPMKKVSNLNSTTCRDKYNISELDFPISPIHETETTPAKLSCPSSHRVPRVRRDKYAPRKTKTAHQPPKCSTMLFSSEISENDLEFSISVIPAESVNPSDVSAVQPGSVKKPIGSNAYLNKEASSTGSVKKRRMSVEMIDSEDDKNHTDKQERALNVVTCTKLPTEEEINKIKDTKASVENSVPDSQRREGSRGKRLSASLHAMKTGMSSLKHIKTKALSCLSSGGSEKSKKSCRVTSSDVTEQIQNCSVDQKSSQIVLNTSKQSVGILKPLDSQSHESLTNRPKEACGRFDQDCPSALYNPTVPDVDDQIYIDVRRHLDGIGQTDLEICSVSRLCLRYRSLLTKNGKGNGANRLCNS